MNETITTNAATGVQRRTGNWATRGTVAAGRGIALAGLTLVGLVLWVVFATAVALAPLGIGLPAIPVTVRAIRRLETRVRRRMLAALGWHCCWWHWRAVPHRCVAGAAGALAWGGFQLGGTSARRGRGLE